MPAVKTKSRKTKKKEKLLNFAPNFDIKAATEGIPCALNPTLKSTALLRQQHKEKLSEIIETVMMMESTILSHPNSTDVLLDKFPALQVGFVARAMGLDLTNQQVDHIIELVHESSYPRGYVSQKVLVEVILEALMTGVLCGPTLVEKGIVKELKRPPSCCVNVDEETIFKAFSALDSENKGYLEEAELRALLESKGEIMTPQEVDTMFTALVDQETGLINYKDVVSIFVHE